MMTDLSYIVWKVEPYLVLQCCLCCIVFCFFFVLRLFVLSCILVGARVQTVLAAMAYGAGVAWVSSSSQYMKCPHASLALRFQTHCCT